MDPVAYGALMLKEILVGMAFAYALGAMYSALAVAGSLLDTLIGFSFGALVDPITGNQSTVISQLYSLFGVMVFIAVDGDSWVVKGLGRTYDAVPLLQAPAIGSLTHGAEIAFSGVFLAAVMIAAPVLIAVTIVDAAFGMVSKVVPQMNVFAVGFPAKMLVGLSLIGATLPFVSGFVVDQLQLSVATALHFLRVA
jgi:flagellar biosynthetic protein FliR